MFAVVSISIPDPALDVKLHTETKEKTAKSNVSFVGLKAYLLQNNFQLLLWDFSADDYLTLKLCYVGDNNLFIIL